MNAQLKLALGIAVALVLTGPATGAIVQINYQGHVTSGTDHTGVFGAADTDLANRRFKATFFFDTALGTFGQLSNSEDLRGGAAYATTSPLISSTFELGGVVLNMRGDYASELHAQRSGFPGDPPPTPSDHYVSAQHQVQTPNGNVETDLNGYEIANPSGALPPSFDAPLTYQVAPGDNAFGLFLYYRYTITPGGPVEVWAQANLTPETYTIGALPSPTGVPEPASWALLIGGFGLAGSVLRRRRRDPAV